ncbi:MAG: G5 domain-containing protein [Oscillospiraceae bacterium]|nr:G5 domain-containing protein [Oscillospiraceae bacterium]
MIRSSVHNGIHRVEILGLREAREFEIIISTIILNHTPWRTIYEYNHYLAEGITNVLQGGGNGTNSITYRIRRINGAEVSREVLSRDVYVPMNRIVEVGAARVHTPPAYYPPDEGYNEDAGGYY